MALVDIALSPIKPVSGWNNAPADAKELTLLLSGGLLRRPCQLLKNEAGIYDKLAIYKQRKLMNRLQLLKKACLLLELWMNVLQAMSAIKWFGTCVF